MPLLRFRSWAVIARASDEHPGVARPGPGGENTIGGRASHHEASEALGSFLLSYAATEVSLLAVGCRRGATPRGQPWTSAVMLPQGCNGLSVRRMAVLWTFRASSLCRHEHGEFMRSGLLDVTPIIPTTACHQRNDVERYSRSMSYNGDAAGYRHNVFERLVTLAQGGKGCRIDACHP